MKNSINIFALFLLFTACEPALQYTPACVGKRIRFIESEGKFNRITYDNQNRQLEYIQARDSISRFSYDTDYAESNQSGTAVQYITDANIVPGLTLVTKTSNTSPGGHQNIYEYDAVGHLVKLNIFSQGATTNKFATITYTWLNGNLVRLESATGLSQPQIIIYTYETNIVNTTGNEFKGFHMFGKTSVNALKSSSSNGAVTNYTYKTDNCGCITDAVQTNGNTSSTLKYIYELVL